MVEYVEAEADVISGEDVMAAEVIEQMPEVIGTDVPVIVPDGATAPDEVFETLASEIGAEEAVEPGVVEPVPDAPPGSSCGCRTFNHRPEASFGPALLLLALLGLWVAVRRYRACVATRPR